MAESRFSADITRFRSHNGNIKKVPKWTKWTKLQQRRDKWQQRLEEGLKTFPFVMWMSRRSVHRQHFSNNSFVCRYFSLHFLYIGLDLCAFIIVFSTTFCNLQIYVCAGIYRDKTIDDKLMYFPNDDTQNYCDKLPLSVDYN